MLMSGLDYDRTVLAGAPLGIMQACLDVMLSYVRKRKKFGRPNLYDIGSGNNEIRRFLIGRELIGAAA